MPCTPHRLAPLPRPSLQHGQGLGDKFSVDYIFMDAQKAVNGTPATGVDEVAWLRAFLWARKALLASWDAVSAVSTPRIDIYQKLVDLGERLGEFQCTDGRQGMRGMPVLRSGQLFVFVMQRTCPHTPCFPTPCHARCRQPQPGRTALLRPEEAQNHGHKRQTRLAGSECLLRKSRGLWRQPWPGVCRSGADHPLPGSRTAALALQGQFLVFETPAPGTKRVMII